jgi:uncharacterized protein YcfJ
MKKVIAITLCAVVVTCAAGCQSNQTRVGEGAAIGGVLGALAGGIIGHNDDRHAGEGLAIGAAAGAATGALIGAQIKKQPAGQTPAQTAAAQPAQTMQAANPNQMSLQQIVDMTKQGVNEAVIVDRIRMSNSKFTLTQNDIKYLQDQGVNQAVIAVMQGY